MMVYVVIIIYQGLVVHVRSFREEKPASRYFEKETGVSWEDYNSRKDSEDNETILKDYAGSDVCHLNVEE